MFKSLLCHFFVSESASGSVLNKKKSKSYSCQYLWYAFIDTLHYSGVINSLMYRKFNFCDFRYMKRRCQFLDRLPAFNYNTGSGEYSRDEQGERIVTNTEQLGSTLMNAMLKEVSDFCGPDIKKNWSEKPHQQVSGHICIRKKFWVSFHIGNN